VDDEEDVDGRYCSNCRAELAPEDETCPECGVFTGDLYDERQHRPRTRWALYVTLLVIAVAAAAAGIWWNAGGRLPQKSAPPLPEPGTHIVADRPGGAKRAPGAVVNEAEAIRLVRHHIVMTRGIKKECVILLGKGFRDGAYRVTASDHCTNTRLGTFRVDGKTATVSP